MANLDKQIWYYDQLKDLKYEDLRAIFYVSSVLCKARKKEAVEDYFSKYYHEDYTDREELR